MDNAAADPPSAAELRSFGLLMGAMLVLVFGLLLPWIWNLEWSRWPWIAGVLFALTGVLTPRLLGPVHFLWMKVGHVLGWINSRIILGLVFLAMFVPAGLIMGLFKDPMARRLEPGLDSYRRPSHQPRTDNLEKPF